MPSSHVDQGMLLVRGLALARDRLATLADETRVRANVSWAVALVEVDYERDVATPLVEVQLSVRLGNGLGRTWEVRIENREGTWFIQEETEEDDTWGGRRISPVLGSEHRDTPELMVALDAAIGRIEQQLDSADVRAFTG